MVSSDRSSYRVSTVAVRPDGRETRWDDVAGEEPLQIRAAGPGAAAEDVAVTMRTPGNEEDLALGFLLAEGLLEASDAGAVEFEFGDPAAVSQPENELVARLPRPLDLDAIARRHFVATASCGICGRASTDELVARVPRLAAGPVVDASVLTSMPTTMRQEQAVFEATGGLHAAGLFSVDGELLELREDIGRHNAVDKLVGARARAGRLPGRREVLLVSGRASFEIVQKAAAAGIPILASVSAPSDLAVVTAQRVGMTLVGFLRDGGFNVYEAVERVNLDA